MLKRVNVPLEKLKFVKGTSYQIDSKYTLDMYKLCALSTTRDTKHAGAEVVKSSEHPHMSNLLYPILQALDEEYLNVDMQFGGVDQRKIFMFAREWLPKIGYRKRSYVMNTLIPGLGKSGKMSSSEPLSKCDLHDAPEVIRKKIKSAFSVDGVSEGNGLLALLRYVLFRYLEAEGRVFVADGVEYSCFSEVEQAWKTQVLVSQPLKAAMSELLAEFLSPLRDYHAAHLTEYNLAYPPVVKQSSKAFDKLALCCGEVTAVADHPESKKHAVVTLQGPSGAVTAVTSEKKAPELAEGKMLVYVANCKTKEVKGVTGTVQLIAISDFNKETKTRSVALLTSESVHPTAIHFGNGAIAEGKDVGFKEADNVLATCKIDQGVLEFGDQPAQPKVWVTIKTNIKNLKLA
jgi:tyrosyl-tRNA synthetase